MEKVILVDTQDNPRGTMEKLEAHRKGELHRAFSILLFNQNGQLMVQRRAADKYHSGGLWTNTCCSHPKPGEVILEAAKRRLQEEMGIKAEIQLLYKFIYRINFSAQMTEHELDYVFVGITEEEPKINKQEVSDWRWLSWKELTKEMNEDKERFTFWFRQIIEHLIVQPYLLPKNIRP